MSFLRRLLGGQPASTNGTGKSPPAAPAAPADPAAAEDEERAYELDLLREEARRLDDLQQRQLRYADRSWTPPAQGGERRADDEDAQQPEG
ncbi:MAG TPA: hypothetical protein VKA85_07000 [Candidatus Limnocylindrales bacterium]|nr:hypothetical protein [Candidatus Limnocylindrales bacterium]